MIAFPSLMKLVFLALAVLHFVGPKAPLLDEDHLGNRYICVSNYSNETRRIVHQDSLGNVLPFGEYVSQPGQQVCGQWQFRHRIGRFGYIVGSDTTWGSWFVPRIKFKDVL